MPVTPRFRLAALTLAVPGLMLGGCSSLDKLSTTAANPLNWVTPYKTDVIQGNFISREQVELLRTGMTRSDVKNLLGTPLLSSLFHADRWDYVFTLKRQGVETQSFKYTVFFQGDQLARFEGDAMPSETDFIARLDSKRNFGKPPVLEATPEQLKEAEAKGPKPANTATSTVLAPAPSATSYPPLEGPRQ
ncbi:MAG: outer membrane protein assembly factor BamE [Pseudomonadota bacterium]